MDTFNKLISIGGAALAGGVVYMMLTKQFGRPSKFPQKPGQHGFYADSRLEFMDRIDMMLQNGKHFTVQYRPQTDSYYELKLDDDICIVDGQYFDQLKTHSNQIKLQLART